MTETEPISQTTDNSPWAACLLQCVMVVFVGAVIGWQAFLLASSNFAPIVLFSLAIGAACGTAALLCARFLAISHRRANLGGALICAASAIACQHFMFYLGTVAAWEAANRLFQPTSELELQVFQEFAKPPSLLELLQAGTASQKAWWLADATLTLAMAGGIAWFLGMPRSVGKESTP